MSPAQKKKPTRLLEQYSDAQLQKLMDTHRSLSAVAPIVGTSRGTLSNELKRRGITYASKGPGAEPGAIKRPRALEHYTDSELQGLMDEHRSLAVVGAMVGVPHSTLNKELKRRGITYVSRKPGFDAALSDWSDDKVRKYVEGFPSTAKAAQALGMNEDTLREIIRTRGIKPHVKSRLRLGLPTDTPTLRPAFPDSQLVKDAGLDPEVWEVSSIGTSETESESGTKYSTRTSFRRRKLPVDKAKRLNPGPPKPISKKAERETWMILTDHHCPHHDPDLHAISCQIMRDIKPDGVLLLGDIMDLSGSISRHPNKANTPDPQANLDSAFSVLCDIREALPETSRVVQMGGNHDIRIATYLQNHASPVAGLRMPDGREALSLRVLLGLDELGIELVTADDGELYPHATWEVIEDKLVAIHGTRARKGGGASARATAIDRGHGVIMGHVHRLAHNVITTYTTKGEPVYRHAVEAGYMGLVKGGLGYAPQESCEWNSGFTVMDVVHGEPHFEQCLWNGEFLYCRGKVYYPDKKASRKAA